MPIPPPWSAEGHQLRGGKSLTAVSALEEVSARSWPPLETADLDGWQLRAAGGVTRRANSAWPRAIGDQPLPQRLAMVTEFYGSRGLTSCIQLTPANQPADLSDRLVQANWRVSGATDVLVAPLSGRSADEGHSSDPHVRLQLSSAPDDDWLAVAGAVTPGHFGAGKAPQALAILAAIQLPTAYAVIRQHDRPVACGRAVLCDGWLGIFSMGTLPAARRHGHAARLLRALLSWGRSRSGARAWLQVEQGNDAEALYRGLGFERVYTYTYATLTAHA